MQFYTWLLLQRSRQDSVGEFARFASRDKIFPKHKSDLHLILLRCEGLPAQREAAKTAHREWRAVRDSEQVAS